MVCTAKIAAKRAPLAAGLFLHLLNKVPGTP
jgi:hypothetical protein